MIMYIYIYIVNISKYIKINVNSNLLKCLALKNQRLRKLLTLFWNCGISTILISLSVTKMTENSIESHPDEQKPFSMILHLQIEDSKLLTMQISRSLQTLWVLLLWSRNRWKLAQKDKDRRMSSFASFQYRRYDPKPAMEMGGESGWNGTGTSFRCEEANSVGGW